MFLGLDRASCGLSSITTEVWQGWVFINMARQPEVSLTSFLGEMAGYLSGLDYIQTEAPPLFIRTYLKCNWKVVADAFAEAYHIPAIHSFSLKPRFANETNPFGRLIDARFYGPHGTISMFGNGGYSPRADQRVEALAFDPKQRSPETNATLDRFNAHPAVNPTKSKDWSMDVNYIFPNTHIDINRLGFFTHQFWPLSRNETRHEARFYVPKPKTFRERFAIEHRAAHAIDVVLEDLSNVERTQRGIESCGTDVMQLSESEILIRFAAHHIDSWTKAATVHEALALQDGDS
jgi:phenylpropionate dioxygenase-like ring-hydroxylating dioxygenase large terminal subunit